MIAGDESEVTPVPEPEDVPAELRERAQWLMWDTSEDKPRAPLNEDGYKASWTDPDEWLSFEQAREIASAIETRGVGYVFAKNNADAPRGLYGALDLDGCVGEPHGSPKEWLPSLTPFIDREAYIEWSPSATGLHIPLAGFEPPEWWSDTDAEFGEHEGVEAYGSKFFTFTGDQLLPTDGDDIDAGGSVIDTGEWVTDWLAEVYKARNGYDPRDADEDLAPIQDDVGDGTDGASGSSEDDEWFGETEAEDALGHISHNVGHTEWFGVGVALVNHLGTSTGGRLFDRWSRGSSKYDERHVESVIEDAGAYPHDVRYLVNAAKNHGWNASAAARKATTADGGTVAAQAGEASTSIDAQADSDGPPSPAAYGFERHNGGYGYWEKSDEDDPAEWNEWSNFEIEVDSFLSMADDGQEEVSLIVHPRHGESYDVRVPPTAFNEKRDFKKQVACGRTTTFTGGETALAKIKTFVGTQVAPDQTGVRHMGRYGDSLVVPGGSLTADGWDEAPDVRYVDQSLGIERKVELSPDYGSVDDEDVAAMLELLPQTRDGERFLPALGWYYAAPLRPFITDMTGEFPLLSITGNTGAGKTSTLEAMSQLFGVGSEPFSASDTKFTMTATLAATNTLPTWYDEYKPSDMADYQVDSFHELIRKSTRGGIESRGNADKSTDEYHLQAPVVVSGEQRFGGPAEQRRSILTTFKEAATDPDGEAAHAFVQLAGGSFNTDDGIEHYEGHDLLAHAHAYHQWLLAYDADDVQTAWRDAEKRVLSLLEEQGVSDVDSAGRTALQTVAFGIGLYREFAHDMGATVPFTDADREQALIYVATQQGDDGKRESHLDEFVRYLSLAAMENELEEDRHYTRVYKADKGSEIRVNMSRAYPKVARFVQNHGLSSTTELLAEGDYRQRIKEGAAEGGSYITRYSQNSPPVGRAFGISVTDAEATVGGFDGDDFYGREEQGENGRYPDEESHWKDHA